MPTPSHVLLVEDDPAIATLLLHWLRHDWPSTACQHATTAHEALALMHSQPIDMVLVDLILPDASGLQVIDALIAAMPPDKPPLPTVVVSGADTEELNQFTALRHGAQEWVSKSDPQMRQHLYEAMCRAWARYRYRESLITGLKEAGRGGK